MVMQKFIKPFDPNSPAGRKAYEEYEEYLDQKADYYGDFLYLLCVTAAVAVIILGIALFA